MMRYTGYAVPCPFCGKALRAMLPQPLTTTRLTLAHDPEICREFWERRDDQPFLDDLARGLRVWPEDKPMGESG